MALFDVNKALEKAAEGISTATKELGNAAQGLSGAAQELGSNIADNIAKAKDAVDGKATKCPNCGHPLSGITATCPMCGYEIRGAKVSSSLTDFVKDIERLKRKQNSFGGSLKQMVVGDNTDEEIANLIRTFIVPNTKEDIFEFMILAANNMDNNILAGKATNQKDLISETVTKAWDSKFQQTYQKAKLSFGEDADFNKIQQLYDSKMKEINDVKATVNWFNKRR